MKRLHQIKHMEWSGRPLAAFGDDSLHHDEWLELDGRRIHCGDFIEILTPSGWRGAYLEKGTSGFYFTGQPRIDPVGIIAQWPRAMR